MDVVLEHTLATDEELAREAAREGSDGPAFSALVERHRERVWRICYRLLGNEHDAQDAAQEVFVRLFLNRSRFEGRSKYATWVHAIAVKTCLTLRRGRSRRVRHELEAASGQPRSGPAPGGGSVALDLYQMLDTLDEEDRALMILKYAEGYTFEELAALFDLTPSACKMRVSRARDRLQQRFGDASQSAAGSV